MSPRSNHFFQLMTRTIFANHRKSSSVPAHVRSSPWTVTVILFVGWTKLQGEHFPTTNPLSVRSELCVLVHFHGSISCTVQEQVELGYIHFITCFPTLFWDFHVNGHCSPRVNVRSLHVDCHHPAGFRLCLSAETQRKDGLETS